MKFWRHVAVGAVSLSASACGEHCREDDMGRIEGALGEVVGSECEPQPAAALVGIGDIPGGSVSSAAYDVTADGKVAVGASHGPSGTHPVRWTLEQGLVSLSEVAGEARAISDAGHVIAGTLLNEDGERSAARWRGAADPELLTVPQPFIEASGGEGISGDGRAVVGFVHPLSTGTVGAAWLVDEEPAVHRAYSAITAANADASVLVGYVVPYRYVTWPRALRNEVPLPYPFVAACTAAGCEPPPCMSPYACEARALDVSSDGAVVVGRATRLRDGAQVAVQWRVEADGTSVATILSSESPAAALAVSGDGRLVVGFETRAGQRVAMQWVDGEPSSVAEQLERAGVVLEGWLLTAAHGASSDGTTLVGEGINAQGEPEGWVAALPASERHAAVAVND